MQYFTQRFVNPTLLQQRYWQGCAPNIEKYTFSIMQLSVYHKSKPSSYLRVMWIRTLPWVMWETVTGVGLYPVEGYYNTRWITRLRSTQVTVEGIVPKDAWHWGRDCSVVNDPLVEPGHTPLYVGLPSAWGSVDGDLMFVLYFVRGAPLRGLRHIKMNERNWRRIICQ